MQTSYHWQKIFWRTGKLRQGFFAFILVFFSSIAVAQDTIDYATDFGSGSSLSHAKTTVNFLAGLRMQNVIANFNGSQMVEGVGTGYTVGFEITSSTKSPQGMWLWNLEHSQILLKIKPNGNPEEDTFNIAGGSLRWGINLGPRFLLSLGTKLSYSLDPMTRKTEASTQELTHEEYGLQHVQVDGLVAIRYLQVIQGKPRLLVELGYGLGLLDRALGETDRWNESHVLVSTGVIW